MRDDWTNYGEVFTRRWVVDTILDLVGYTADADLGARVLVEPSIGSGAFLLPVVERLVESARAEGRPVESLGAAIRGYDLLSDSVEYSRRAVADFLVSAGVVRATARALATERRRVADFLLVDGIPQADYVVGNPPYIRLEDIPDEVTQAYRDRWRTMRGRADIYVGFYERSLGLLKDGGKLGFICADRWMRNQYGAALRGFVVNGFAVENVWVMHDVDAFETQVSAYPAITILSTAPQRDVVAADTTSAFDAASAAELSGWVRSGSGLEVLGRGFAAYRMRSWFEGDDMWPAGPPALIALMEHLNEHYRPLSDTANVGIGVATGADKTYIVKHAPVEEDRLLPLSMVGDLRSSGEFQWSGYYLVNPWSDAGSLVTLEQYPKLQAYLEKNSKLRDRHTAKKNPQQWFRTIDKVSAELVGKPKLLIQDMRATINPVLEPGGFYPHHNLYFLTSDIWDLEVLGGVLISRIGQGFIEAYGVRMRGGTLRFQAQYLRKIRLPEPSAVTVEVAGLLREAFRARDVEAATRAAAEAYGIDAVKYDLLTGERLAYVGGR